MFSYYHPKALKYRTKMILKAVSLISKCEKNLNKRGGGGRIDVRVKSPVFRKPLLCKILLITCGTKKKFLPVQAEPCTGHSGHNPRRGTGLLADCRTSSRCTRPQCIQSCTCTRRSPPGCCRSHSLHTGLTGIDFCP